MNNKINASVVPEGFSFSLALVDLVPVIFFGLTFGVLGFKLENIPIIIGALVCLVSGVIKVAWKIVVVLRQKNVWWMFVQMRIAMPIGFLIMVIAAVFSVSAGDIHGIFTVLLSMPNLIFLIVGILGILCMIGFSIFLDSSDTKSNWLEQCVNGLAQICFFLALII